MSPSNARQDAALSGILPHLSDTQIVGLTLWGGGRGEPIEGRIGIGCVIRNRLQHVGRFGEGYGGVCLRPLQFSCWWTAGGLSNHGALVRLATQIHTGEVVESAVWRECLYVAVGLIDEHLTDRVDRATHYYNPR